MQAQSLHEAYQPLLPADDDGGGFSRDGSFSKDGGCRSDSSFLDRTDRGGSDGANCVVAWAVPASSAAKDVSWLIFTPGPLRFRSRGIGMNRRSRLLLLGCALCMAAALAVVFASIGTSLSRLTPPMPEAGALVQMPSYRMLSSSFQPHHVINAMYKMSGIWQSGTQQ